MNMANSKGINSDPWEQPLSQDKIDRAKKFFVEGTGLPLFMATCHGCLLQQENRCAVQWDTYNTDGDCLLEK